MKHPHDIRPDPYEGTSREAVGNRLALTRRALGFPQGEFAAGAGIAPSTYNQYESGKYLPKVESALAICERYRLTLDWIYRGDSSGLPYSLGDKIHVLRQP